MCTNKRKRRLIALRLIFVFVVLLLMLSCAFSVSAASYESEYQRYTYTSVAATATTAIQPDGSFIDEIGDYRYDRVSGSFPNHLIFSFANAGSRDSLPFMLVIDFRLFSTFSPGEYLFEFDLALPVNSFHGYDEIYYADLENSVFQWVSSANPVLYTSNSSVGNNGQFEANLIQSTDSVPYAGYRHDKFQVSVNLTEAAYIQDLRIYLPYEFVNGVSWPVDGMTTFVSDLVVKTYTDNPAAVDKYNPPSTEDQGIVNDYLDKEQDTQDFISGNDKEISDSLTIAGVFDNQYLFQAMQTIQDIYRTLTSSLPWLSTLITISVGLGVSGFVLNLVSIVFSRRK